MFNEGEGGMKKEVEALLKEIEDAYGNSIIKKDGLYYSLITGSLQNNQPLIIGFNWGANDKIKYKPDEIDEIMKMGSLGEESLGSMKRAISFCKRTRFGEGFLDSASQTNYCFFRSKAEKDILPHDLKLCQPIFDKLLTLLTPSIIFCFSSQLRDYLCNSQKVIQIQKENFPFKRGGKDVACYATKGVFNEVKIVFLPHPNSPIPGKTRSDAWDFAEGNT
jgi:hypothetical protein